MRRLTNAQVGPRISLEYRWIIVGVSLDNQ